MRYNLCLNNYDRESGTPKFCPWVLILNFIILEFKITTTLKLRFMLDLVKHKSTDFANP